VFVLQLVLLCCRTSCQLCPPVTWRFLWRRHSSQIHLLHSNLYLILPHRQISPGLGKHAPPGSKTQISNAQFNSVLMPKPKPPPKAPAEFDVPGTSLSLEFSDYARGVQAGEVLLVFLQSLLKAFDTILGAGRDVPLTEDERFEEISVYMIIYGGRRMTYGIMRAAIGAIVGFMIEYGTFGIHVKITRDDQTISNILIGRK